MCFDKAKDFKERDQIKKEKQEMLADLSDDDYQSIANIICFWRRDIKNKNNKTPISMDS